MLYYVVEEVVDALNKRGRSINSSKVLILGLAYKKNIDDTGVVVSKVDGTPRAEERRC